MHDYQDAGKNDIRPIVPQARHLTRSFRDRNFFKFLDEFFQTTQLNLITMYQAERIPSHRTIDTGKCANGATDTDKMVVLPYRHPLP